MATLTIKPNISLNIEQELPRSLNDLRTGLYYVKARHHLVFEMLSYDQPDGANYELVCWGNGRDKSLWDGGKVIVKIRKTDQKTFCKSITWDEYRYARQVGTASAKVHR